MKTTIAECVEEAGLIGGPVFWVIDNVIEVLAEEPAKQDSPDEYVKYALIAILMVIVMITFFCMITSNM